MPSSPERSGQDALPYTAADLVWIAGLPLYSDPETSSLRIAEHAPFHGPLEETCMHPVCVKRRRNRRRHRATGQPWEPR